jgi:hypothetical protein
MIKLFLNKTDNFLCSSVRNIFEKTEDRYKQKDLGFNLEQELRNFEENPLGCVIGIDSKFETDVKIKIKLLLGLFFVLVPLLGFELLSYILNIEATYAFILTFIVALGVASRMESIAKKYSQTRFQLI